jgi:hypothetical protein
MTTKKGLKRIKNQPVYHDEIKGKRTVFLTPTAWDNIKDEAKNRGISASELVEEWGRRLKSPTASPHA